MRGRAKKLWIIFSIIVICMIAIVVVNVGNSKVCGQNREFKEMVNFGFMGALLEDEDEDELDEDDCTWEDDEEDDDSMSIVDDEVFDEDDYDRMNEDELANE